MAGMTIFARLLALGTPLAFLAGCANRSVFIPDGSTTTVGMPAGLSDRERNHASEMDAALRREGYLPVRHGAGELELEFRISEGPINTSTANQFLPAAAPPTSSLTLSPMASAQMS